MDIISLVPEGHQTILKSEKVEMPHSFVFLHENCDIIDENKPGGCVNKSFEFVCYIYFHHFFLNPFITNVLLEFDKMLSNAPL